MHIFTLINIEQSDVQKATYDEFTEVEGPVVAYTDQSINAVNHPEGASSFLGFCGRMLHGFCQDIVFAIDFV